MADGGNKADFKLTIGALDRFSKTFEDFGEKVNASTAGIRRYGQEMEVAGKRISTALNLPKLTKAFEDLKKSGEKVGKAFKDMALRAAGIGVAAGGALFGLYKLVRSYTDSGDEAAKAAQKAGITVAAWQEMAYAASLSDVNNEQLLGSYQKLNKAMIEAAQGGKSQAETFKKLGITLMNSKGELKATDEVMLEVADAFAKMPEGAAKTAMAMELFGKSGAQMLPMLNSGKDGLMETRREAERLGLVMGKDAAAASEEFNDNVTRLQARIKGVGMIIGGAFMPAMGQLITSFSDLIDKNRDLIKTKVEEYAKKFAAAIPSIVKGVEKVVKFIPKVITGFEWLVDKLGATGVAGAGFAAIFGGPILTAVAGFVGMIKPLATIFTSILGPLKMIWTGLGYFSGFAKILGIALKMLATNPFFLVITGFIVALKLIINYFGGWESWCKLMQEGLTALGDDIMAVGGWIMDKLGGALKWVLDFLDPVITAVKDFAGAFSDFLQPAIDAAMKFIQPVIDQLSKLLDLISDVANPGAAIGEAINGPIKTEEQMKSDAVAQQRSEMLRKRDAGEISNEQYNSFKAASYAPAATPAPAGGAVSAATPALAGTAVSAAPGGGVQKTEHTEVKQEKVEMTLNLPPGVTMSPAGGPVPDNVKVSGRASALGVANAG
jgi:phage-related protein